MSVVKFAEQLLPCLEEFSGVLYDTTTMTQKRKCMCSRAKDCKALMKEMSRFDPIFSSWVQLPSFKKMKDRSDSVFIHWSNRRRKLFFKRLRPNESVASVCEGGQTLFVAIHV